MGVTSGILRRVGWDVHHWRHFGTSVMRTKANKFLLLQRCASMDAEEPIHRLDEHVVSDDHMVALFTEERIFQFPIALLSPSMLARRYEVSVFFHMTLANLQWLVDDMFFCCAGA